jgi:hypothetical protein
MGKLQIDHEHGIHKQIHGHSSNHTLPRCGEDRRDDVGAPEWKEKHKSNGAPGQSARQCRGPGVLVGGATIDKTFSEG